MSLYLPTHAEMLTVACPLCKEGVGAECKTLGLPYEWSKGDLLNRPTEWDGCHINRMFSWSDEQSWKRELTRRLADAVDHEFRHLDDYDEFEDEHGNNDGDIGGDSGENRTPYAVRGSR